MAIRYLAPHGVKKVAEPAPRIITGQNGQTIYQLNDDKGSAFLYLLKLDEHILVFPDARGKPLVCNEDFSYTLNGRW